VAVLLKHAALALAQARQDDDSVPWEQVKVDLGLV